jgi:hypothetical protein
MSAVLCTILAVQTASAASLGAPADGSSQSGIGLIRGWVCEATEVTIRIDGGEEIPAVYGNPRGDTESLCGDSDNGFELLWNWNLSGDGEHTVEAFADGVSIGSSVFTVTTLGLGEFVRGLSGTFTLNDFPAEGQNTTVAWSEAEQNFLISAVEKSGLLNPTGQTACYDDTREIECPEEGLAFYGQDAQTAGRSFSFTDNGDGTVSDNITGLMWQQSPDTDGDGMLDAGDKLTFEQALSYCEDLELAGKSDWQLPNIKALYSLIDFTGIDPSGYEGTDTAGLTPFIDTDYFDFAYGDTGAGERIIDAQFASSTQYAATVTEELLFGVNFADGRIKGYGLSLMGADKTFNVYCVRGGEGYGSNDFEDNGDGTVSDHSTSLMWAQQDSGSDVPAGLNWEESLVWVELKNAEAYLGFSDWRLPNVKEMQSLLDYTRSPDTTGSVAIDPLFEVTGIINEAGQEDFPMYWSGTTHANMQNGTYAAYVAFGRAMGYMNNNWRDVHGAGAQRSDPKSGDPADYPTGNGPQGDAIRIYNHARLVRDQ